jgi:hypothetical protein
MSVELDGIGRPVLEGRAAQYSAFNKLLRAALRNGVPDDWEGPLGAAEEMAYTLDDTNMLLRVLYVEEILWARWCKANGFEYPSEDDIRKEFGLPPKINLHL